MIQPSDYSLIYEYYAYRFGAWHVLIKPLSILAGISLVIGIFLSPVRAGAMVTAFLFIGGAGLSWYQQMKDRERLQKLEAQFIDLVFRTVEVEKIATQQALGNITGADLPPFYSWRAVDYALPSPANPAQRSYWGTRPEFPPTSGPTFSTIAMRVLYCVDGWMHCVEVVFDLRQPYREFRENIQWSTSEVNVSYQTVASPLGGHELALVASCHGETWTVLLPNTPESTAHISALQHVIRASKDRRFS